jgi:hypothetical protein
MDDDLHKGRRTKTKQECCKPLTKDTIMINGDVITKITADMLIKDVIYVIQKWRQVQKDTLKSG